MTNIPVHILISSIKRVFNTSFQFNRSPINYLLLSLAVADILFATFIAPNVFFIHLSFAHHPDGMTGTVLCILLTNGNVAWVGATSSIVNLAAIAIERYYVVMYPHDNKGKFTKGKLKVSWLID